MNVLMDAAGRLKCLRCGHMWFKRQEALPEVCPKCKSPYWKSYRRSFATLMEERERVARQNAMQIARAGYGVDFYPNHDLEVEEGDDNIFGMALDDAIAALITNTGAISEEELLWTEADEDDLMLRKKEFLDRDQMIETIHRNEEADIDIDEIYGRYQAFYSLAFDIVSGAVTRNEVDE